MTRTDVTHQESARGPGSSKGLLRFDGRVAVVTGAGRGIGRAHALLLAERGAAVVVNDIGAGVNGAGADLSVAESVAAEIRAHGGKAVADGNSVATSSGAASIIDTAIRAFGRVDILVNNAGILTAGGVVELTDEDIDQMLRVHVYGSIHMVRAVWPHLAAQRYGRIVNTTSSRGFLGGFESMHYGAAKGAVLGLTRCLALDGEPHGIHVNAIAPSGSTRMLDVAKSRAPLPDVPALRPHTASPMVAWLAHESCRVTGETFSTELGRMAHVVVGVTSGIRPRNLTPEVIRDHLEEVMDGAQLRVPRSSAEEFARVLSADQP